MRIIESVYSNVVNLLPMVPPETGGILGERNEVICDVVIDHGFNRGHVMIYEPQVELLNQVINDWNATGIAFCGMFHSHPRGQQSLSCGDEMYIKKIMEVMPNRISKLYFPLVFPGTEMIGYLAKWKDSEVVIVPDDIIIVKE